MADNEGPGPAHDVMNRGVKWTENEERAFASALADAPRLTPAQVRDLYTLLRAGALTRPAR